MGRVTALAFAKEGAHVITNDIDEASLKETADEIQAVGGNVTTLTGDITSSEFIYATVGKAIEQYGRADILFNHVGGNPNYAQMSLFTEQDEAYWNRIIELNLKSTMIFCRAVLDSMMKQQYGKIVNLAAIAGKVGSPRMVAYSAVKGGVIAFTKALAQEVAPYKINVNCICPGPIDTPGFAKVFSEEDRKSAPAGVPLQRVGTSEEIASTVLFLASDEAAFITGQALSVDGGMTMV